MNNEIRFNLSEYYDSLLDNEANVLVLAFIEQSGTTTEEEISKEGRFKEKEIKSIIVKLFKNQLIEISKDFLKISLKGKKVLDSLNLSNELVRHHYLPIKLSAEEKLFMFNSIQNYRNNYYHHYLHTCNSLKTWSRITKSIYFKKEAYENQIGESYVFIIMNDFFSVLSEAQDNRDNKTFGALFDQIGSISEEINEDTSKSRIVLKWLKEFYSIKTKDELSEYSNLKRELFEYTYCKNVFLTDLKEQTNWVIKLKESKTKDLNEATFNSYQYWKDVWLKNNELNSDFTKQHLLIAGQSLKSYEKNSLDTILFLLENSDSVKDLASKIGKPIPDTSELIDKIRHQLKKLS